MNPLKSTRIEFHILQSFPVSCLNRDDVGSPKTAIVGGVPRARVSSQCWKRSVRLAMQEQGTKIASRTKLIESKVEAACKKNGATDAQAKTCAEAVSAVFIKSKTDKKNNSSKEEESAESVDVSNGKSDTLLFISDTEIGIIADALKDNNFSTEFNSSSEAKSSKGKKNIEAKLQELLGKPNLAIDGLDIALFGRMVAQATTLNIEAAASFSHAISTHKVTNEIEFFTALDDCATEQGSAHMGSLEFNSATYYRYVCLDLGQLWDNLAGHAVKESIEAFIKALFVAVPSARQSTMSGASPWEFARIYMRKGQRLQVPFDAPVKSNGGFFTPSKIALTEYLDLKEKLFGSLFGKIKSFDFGDKATMSIDDLINDISKSLEKVK